MPAADPSHNATRWRVLVPVVCLVAGIGFAVSARASSGTELRAPEITTLADTVRAAEHRVQSAGQTAAALQGTVDRLTRSTAAGHGAVASAQRRVQTLSGPGGLTALHGPGLEVVLDDAPGAPPDDPGVDPNQLLIHQSDLQSVVNALWAGGAESMSISGQRVIATSAVRCVGPTLLLNGRVFSPPYRIDAIGPSRDMQAALATSPGVQFFQEAASYYGLGYTVATQSRVDVPAYVGPLTLTYAHADGTR